MRRSGFFSLRYIARAVPLLFLSTLAAATPVEETLKLHDSARTPAQFTYAITQLKSVEPADSSRLRKFALDSSKPARKRIIAFRALLELQDTKTWLGEIQARIEADADDHFHALCAEEVGYRKLSKGTDFLHSVTNSSDFSERIQVSAAFGLAALGDARGKARALRSVTDGEPWANVGIRALERFKDPSVLSTLDDAASTTSSRSSSKSRLAALRVRLALASNVKSVDLLEKAIKESGDREVSKWAAMRLGRRGDKVAGKRLAEIIKSKDPAVKHAASKALEMGVNRGFWSRSEIETWVRNGTR